MNRNHIHSVQGWKENGRLKIKLKTERVYREIIFYVTQGCHFNPSKGQGIEFYLKYRVI